MEYERRQQLIRTLECMDRWGNDHFLRYFVPIVRKVNVTVAFLLVKRKHRIRSDIFEVSSQLIFLNHSQKQAFVAMVYVAEWEE